MSSDVVRLFRIKFKHSEFLKLPQEEQLFFVQLAHVADDLRHVFYLCVAAEKGLKSGSTDERKLALHQLLFGVRLIYSILNEGWNLIRKTWHGTALGKKWHPQLSNPATDALDVLGKYFSKENLSRTIRDHFGFHYLADHLREPLSNGMTDTDEIISGFRSRNVFYTFAEEVRALALIQLTLPDTVSLWDQNDPTEDLLKAVDRLYTAFHPIHDAFENFANDVLTKVVQSLPHTIEKFTEEKVTSFAEMKPILFVEEP